MKQRPILMSAPMVRAVLSGQKTQTRRILKPQPVLDQVPWRQTSKADHGWVRNRDGQTWRYDAARDGQQRPQCGPYKCPYGVVGDQLWVRENFAKNEGKNGGFLYRADHEDRVGNAFLRMDLKTGEALDYYLRWTPSIHMPRAASRIMIEIEAISIERLQDISKADVMAEGCVDREGEPLEDVHAGWHEPYAQLWDKINGEGAWAKNPWVWVITFQRIKP